jgi:hypothetical protein
MVSQTVTKPAKTRAARKRQRGRFTDKGTPEVIPGRKAMAFEIMNAK